jgi:hypothetical protein
VELWRVEFLVFFTWAWPRIAKDMKNFSMNHPLPDIEGTIMAQHGMTVRCKGKVGYETVVYSIYRRSRWSCVMFNLEFFNLNVVLQH